jgi:hypothetical protein
MLSSEAYSRKFSEIVPRPARKRIPELARAIVLPPGEEKGIL